MTFKRWAGLSTLALALAACGGGGNDSNDGNGSEPAGESFNQPGQSSTEAPSGLYVGYYKEDAANNPEDPTLGAYVLNLPATNGAFSGSMFFTYYGCQSANVGRVAGSKSFSRLSGTWSGTIDGSPQTGTYIGSYDAGTQAYAGTYRVSRGKQHVDLSPCIEYDIAAYGTWEMFAVNTSTPASFQLTQNQRLLAWGAVETTASTLVYVMDPAIAQGSGNPVLWQTLLGPDRFVAIPPQVNLQSGRVYIAAVGLTNSAGRRIAFSSRQFTAP